MRNKFHFIPAMLLGLVISTSVHSADSSANTQQGKFLGAMPTEYPEWFKESFLDFNEDIKEAAAANKRLMVVFHQDGCPYCNALIERNLAQKEIEAKVKKHFDVVAINMWGSREVASIDGVKYSEKSFAAALKVQFTPTILFFNEQGKVILRLNGYLPPPRFKVAIDYIADKHENTTSYRDYVAKHLPVSAQKARTTLYAQDFFIKGAVDLSKDKSKPVALVFEQKDCPNCDTLHDKIFSDQGIRQTLKDFIVVQLDIWSDAKLTDFSGKKVAAREFAKSLDIKYAPTIVVFNPQGKEVIRSEAFFKTFHTHGILTYVLSSAYKEQPSFQRYLADRAHKIQASGKDVNIWGMDEGK